METGGYLASHGQFRSLDHLRDTASFTGSVSSECSESLVQRLLLYDEPEGLPPPLAAAAALHNRSPQELLRAYEQLQQRLHLDMAVRHHHQQQQQQQQHQQRFQGEHPRMEVQ